MVPGHATGGRHALGQLPRLLALLLSLAVLLALLPPASAVASQPLIFLPVADAHVDSDYPTSNFGSAARLSVDASPVRETYLTFALSGLRGTVASATLRVYVTTDPSYSDAPSGGSVARISDTSWSEASVTYDTRPAIDGPVLTVLGPVSRGQWYEFDVTAAVSGDGTLSLALTTSDADGAYYASREDSDHAPQLVLSLVDAAVAVDRTTPAGASRLAVGVTHTRDSADGWNDPAAVRSARQLLQASARYQNQHLMGWGALNPEPSPGVYDWGSLDARLALIRQTGGIPVLTLCCAPDWMKGGAPGTTAWSKLEDAPLPEHYADFAELARQAALRYPDVRHFQVWNELKGFYDPERNRWKYEEYTALYNLVYDALKSVDPDLKVGGPYVVMDSWSDRADMSHPSDLSGPYGTIDRRALDVLDYWLAHKRGADFIAVDGGTGNKDRRWVTDPFTAAAKFADVNAWIAARTELPIWWAEWYASGGDKTDLALGNALMANALIQLLRSGAAVALMWGPQGDTSGVSYPQGLWTDTRVPGGGQATPYYRTAKALRDAFGPGTPLYRATSSSPEVAVLASDTRILLVNTSATARSVSVEGTIITLAPYEVRLL